VAHEPPVAAKSTHAAVAGLIVAQQLSFVWGLTSVWWTWGPGNPAVALIAAAWTFIVSAQLAPLIRFLPLRRCHVPAGERVLHHLLGVGVFERLLERSGYNRRMIYPAWGGPLTRARLSFRAAMAQGSGAAHAAGFAIHLLLAAAAFLMGHPWGAFWILLPGVVVHLYPVLLQRSIMLRLQPLLDRYGSGRSG
jgi:hypothetical protein